MPRVKKGYSLDDAFKLYKEKHYKRGNSYKVDKATYRKICYAFNQRIAENIREGMVMRLPHSLGSFWAKKFKINWSKPPVDLNASKKAGKIVYHLNDHSDGWCIRWNWSKRNNLITNLIYYSFEPTRTNSRALSAEMQKPGGHKKFFS